MRRTLGTDMQKHGTLKDTQGILRHASITTTGDVYVQTIEQSVLKAVNSRTAAVLEGWTAPVESMGVAGRNCSALLRVEQDCDIVGREGAVSCHGTRPDYGLMIFAGCQFAFELAGNLI